MKPLAKELYHKELYHIECKEIQDEVDDEIWQELWNEVWNEIRRDTWNYLNKQMELEK